MVVFSKKLLFFNNLFYLCDMGEHEKSSFWDLLIWVTVLGAGTFALEGLCIHFFDKGWVRIVFFLVGIFFLVRESIVESRKPERVAKVGALTLTEVTKIVSLAMSLFPLVFLPGDSVSQQVRILLLLAFFPVGAWGLHGTRRKEEKEARREEERQREPLNVRDRAAVSARKAFIVVAHARQVDLEFEVDDRMFLYSLPDGRFLVLFRKDVPLDAFLGQLADFRTEVDADEDAIGYYGFPHDGPRPDLPLAFVCNQNMESRPFDFNPSTVPISAAVPV